MNIPKVSVRTKLEKKRTGCISNEEASWLAVCMVTREEVVWCGVVKCGMVWCGEMWYGVVW